MYTYFAHKKNRTHSRGFTLVELIVGMFILALVSGIVWVSFRGYNRQQALEGATQAIVAVLNDARARTVNGRDAEQYGVHIESDSITLFVGSTYTVSTVSNEVVALNTQAIVADVSLSGGGDDVVFERLTGETVHNGTIRVELVDDASRQVTITIQNTGLISYN